MANFKLLEEPKTLGTNQQGLKPLLSYKKESSTMAKKPDMSRTEACLHRQAKVIEAETQMLNLDKTDDPKSGILGGVIKSKFEVMLDFM
jgi:hypothetical protein